MSRTVADSIKALLLAFPKVEETTTHGTPTYKAAGKSMAYFCRNHHNDGRIAVWIKFRKEDQQGLVDSDPDRFFVPPYVGPSGWLGVDLGGRVDWGMVAGLLEEGYRQVAPKRALAELDAARAPKKSRAR